MRVKITNLQPINSEKYPDVYIADDKSKCRDVTDETAYLLCIEHKKTIVVGKTIAEPYGV